MVKTESFHNCSRISVQCSVKNLVSYSRSTIKMECGSMCSIDSDSRNSALHFLKSVAMNADIAQSAQEEVQHFMHVDSSKNSRLSAASTTDITYSEELKPNPPAEYNLSNVYCAGSSVSHILPSEEGNIISAVVLSKWDDIVGPQTVYVWLKNKVDMINVDTRRTVGHSLIRNLCIAKSVKYVTTHTVNYTGLNLVMSPSCSDATVNPVERNSGIFIVPELDLIAQSLIFQLQNHELNVPYSLAVIVSYQHYSYYLHLRQLFQLWLQRTAARLRMILQKSLSSNSAFENSDQVNDWMIDMCYMMLSLKSYGLTPATHVESYHVLNNLLLERVLTSHLQTFGCTVVMGTSSEDINSLISFLALFLDTDELHCSRFVLPPENCFFHAGLFLQGLLLNEYGCRELCSTELAANPYPVTAVDLTRGIHAAAVKQTPLHHRRWQVPQREYHQFHDEGQVQEPGPEHSLHESVFHPVKEGAHLVCGFLEDMRHLPSSLWSTYIQLFKQKLNSLAFSLLNLVCWMRNDCAKRQHRRYLAQVLDLEEPDLLIVLAVAEKLQPGVYAYVMSESSVVR
ncbi:guanine nucleotide exchange C9orf72 homolog [Zootermopsis nevadensis]|uniref:guanine nucleotide exchange C9orf72 homolog n=1 Tax=Zootermopsis nevadensis TaxID=136037 RepID=UPI000B8E6788|nr:guanine nucleotide exchange C9orf72 homolog [Zootermopsis nevadensis]